MKFQHLPIGARFEFEGQVYVKTGPIAAASEQGGQRMIPRHAVLRPLDAPVAPSRPVAGRKLDAAKVEAAFAAFCRECLGMIDEPARLEFEAARRRFLDALGSGKDDA